MVSYCTAGIRSITVATVSCPPLTSSSCSSTAPCSFPGLWKAKNLPIPLSQAFKNSGLGSLKSGRRPSYRRRGVSFAFSDGDKKSDGVEVEQVDRNYFAVVGGGCLVGAAVVKYGSLLIPQVTQQANLPLALTMILGPMVIASIVLFVIGSKGTSS